MITVKITDFYFQIGSSWGRTQCPARACITMIRITDDHPRTLGRPGRADSESVQ